jgi:hypothetical protein
MRADKVMRSFANLFTAILNDSLVRKSLKKSKKNLSFLPFEGKNDNFDPTSSSKERYGVQLSVEKVFMFTISLQLEKMSSEKVMEPRQ